MSTEIQQEGQEGAVEGIMSRPKENTEQQAEEARAEEALVEALMSESGEGGEDTTEQEVTPEQKKEQIDAIYQKYFGQITEQLQASGFEVSVFHDAKNKRRLRLSKPLTGSIRLAIAIKAETGYEFSKSDEDISLNEVPSQRMVVDVALMPTENVERDSLVDRLVLSWGSGSQMEKSLKNLSGELKEFQEEEMGRLEHLGEKMESGIKEAVSMLLDSTGYTLGTAENFSDEELETMRGKIESLIESMPQDRDLDMQKAYLNEADEELGIELENRKES